MAATFTPSPHDNTIDPRLLRILQLGVAGLPPGYRVQLTSGREGRGGRTSYHPGGKAADTQIYDDQGRALNNYQDPTTFPIYQQYANAVRRAQLQNYPDMPSRWGGYFYNGGRGQYGALDLMHHDIGDTPMGGGTWESGPNEIQRAAWNLPAGGGLGANVAPMAFGMSFPRPVSAPSGPDVGSTAFMTGAKTNPATDLQERMPMSPVGPYSFGGMRMMSTPPQANVGPTAFGTGTKTMPPEVAGTTPVSVPDPVPVPVSTDPFGSAFAGLKGGTGGSSKTGDGQPGPQTLEGNDFGALLASLSKSSAQAPTAAPLDAAVDPRILQAFLSQAGLKMPTIGTNTQFGLANLLKGYA